MADPLKLKYHLHVRGQEVLGQGSDGVVGFGVVRSGQEGAGEMHALFLVSQVLQHG